MDRTHLHVPEQAGSTRRTVLRGGVLVAGTAAVWTTPVASVLGLSPLDAASASGHASGPHPDPPLPVPITYTAGSWQFFEWNALGDLWTIPTFTAPLLGARVLLVDAFLKGDRFQLFEGPVPLGETSTVPDDSTGTTSDPDTAWSDPTYSRGTFLLGPGPHDLSIRTSHSPHPPPGGAFYRIDLAA